MFSFCVGRARHIYFTWKQCRIIWSILYTNHQNCHMELILAWISLESCTSYQHSVCSVSCLSAQGPVDLDGSKEARGEQKTEDSGCLWERSQGVCVGAGRVIHGVSSLWIHILSRRMNDFSCVVLSALALFVNPYPLPFSGVGGSWPSVLYVLFLEYVMGKGGAFSLKVNLMWFWGLSNLCGSIGEDSKSSFFFFLERGDFH